MKLQKKDAGGRKIEQPPNHPQPMPSTVQSAVGCAHPESDSTATNGYPRTDPLPSPTLVCEETASTIFVITRGKEESLQAL